ncbi:MAG: FtsX-like permease family protein [bacterium]|nr:FtsX-like permease family protein [bacterium]
MNLILKISLRNLFRQKRRNVLLGIAIAFGVMILVIANSFANGITDVLLNKLVARIAGHVSIAFSEKSNFNSPIFRDKEKIFSVIKNNNEGVREVEENVGVFGRAIGNGKADTIIIVGIDLSKELSAETRKEIEESFRMIEGTFQDLSRKDVENPTIVSEEKAKYLKVKKGDIIRVRYTNLFGNDQAARLTIVGILKNDNVFMQGVIFAELGNLKKLMGFRPYEIGNISITMNDAPKNAVKLANKIHSQLKPDIAVIYGQLKYNGKIINVSTLGFKTDDESKKVLEKKIKVINGEIDKVSSKKNVLINKTLFDALGIKPGESFEIVYKNKFEDKETIVKYNLTAVFADDEMTDKNIVFLSEDKFYETYYDNLPEDPKKIKDAFYPKANSSLTDILATEWILLKRTSTTDELTKKYKDMGKGKWKATIVDVQTMYESASDVLKLEKALNLITISAVLVLFFIILIGVVNTLRMTIRERTREIGTIRAIGMQKNDVRNTFILETFFLTLFASFIGIASAFVVMRLLSTVTFNVTDNPMSILLVNSHLYFFPTFLGISSNVLFILIIAVVTAYFPARRAANLSPATALRHYE